MTAVLKTCPCCGAEAKPQIPMIGVFLIRCSNGDCGCSVGSQSLEVAAEKWNRRTPRSGKEQAYDDMEPDLKRLHGLGQRLGWPGGDRLLASAIAEIETYAARADDDSETGLLRLSHMAQQMGRSQSQTLLDWAADAIQNWVDSGTPRRDPLPRLAYVERADVEAARQAADAEDLRDNARHELLLLLAQLVAGTMLRPDAGLLIYLDDGRSTTRHIPVNVRERLLYLMTAVRPSG